MHSFQRPTPVTITITLNFVSFEFIIFFFSPSEWKKNSPYEVGYPVLYSILIALPLLPFLCFMIQTKESLERQVSLMVLTYRGSRKGSRFFLDTTSRNCDRSESYWIVLSCGAICHAGQNDNILWICWWNSEVWIRWNNCGGFKFRVCKWNIKVWLFHWNLLSNTSLWFCYCIVEGGSYFGVCGYNLNLDQANKNWVSSTERRMYGG